MPHIDRAVAVNASQHDIEYPAAVPFLLVHLGCLAAIWTGITWKAVAIGVVLYVLRIFGIGAGYHRYFSHRAFSTSRAFQFVLAILAQSSAQSSVLWWAARHRDHHLHSDTEEDAHSPRHRGFLYAHMGWIFDRRHRPVDPARIADLARYPELRWLQRYEYAPAALLALTCFLLAGWSGLVVGFLWSTVAVYHATFCINSLAHTHGRQRYVTGDTSRNNWLLALFTMGEGWHNNHHAYQASVRQGFRWWQVDPTFYVLWTLCRLGVIRNLKAPPQSIVRNETRPSARALRRAAEQLAAQFSVQPVGPGSSGGGPGHPPLRARAPLDRPAGRLQPIKLEPPSLDALRVAAAVLFSENRWLDAVVEQASESLGATPLQRDLLGEG